MVEHRRDWLFGLTALENAGIGFVFGGPWGAAFGAGKTLGDGLFAYFEGRNPPKNTFMEDDVDAVTGLRKEESDAYSVLNHAQKIGATQMILVNYQNSLRQDLRSAYDAPVTRRLRITEPGYHQLPGVVKRKEQLEEPQMYFSQPGEYDIPQTCAPVQCAPTYQCIEVPATAVIYAKDAYDICQTGNCVRFRTTNIGANHLLGLLYNGLMQASFQIPSNHSSHTSHRPSKPSYGGGQSGAPLGDHYGGSSYGGGQSGHNSGNSYGGQSGYNPGAPVAK